MRPSAVLFDLDGTLVDSERVWLDVIRTRLAVMGSPVSSSQLAALEGLSSIDAARALIEGGAQSDGTRSDGAQSDGTRSDGVTELAAELEDLTIDAFGGRLPWIPGAEEALGYLRREGIRLALVTSSTRRWVDAVAQSVCLGPFDVVVTADDVQQTKPHPEPYLRAIDLLDVDPGSCLVFEDSAVGVRAAARVGCRVVQVRAELQSESGATACIPDLRAVTVPWIASLMTLEPALP
ncbi:HAD family hydrolase [Microbacterium sp. NPDC058269]|uniref:HAD family hydrolase n=1 Tax=Microbacterium sp. NPDC058269 TaxID=3346414 RepID=UPI0036D85818